MKILYGVQGTGNGHITRSRIVIPLLRSMGHEVDVIISGRKKEKYFDMETFEPYQIKHGLTFITAKGKVKIVKTVMNLNIIKFIKDIRGQDISNIDLIISDYEPITAWVAKMKKKVSMGIAHQYAFAYKIPIAGDDFFSRKLLNFFAPVDIGLGIHWHNFGQPLLPPIIPNLSKEISSSTIKGKVLVYLPFEDLNEIIDFLNPYKEYDFYIYHDIKKQRNFENFYLRPFSRIGFKNDLISSAKVICNAGFELPSEALLLGKNLLVKPLIGQMEQVSNAEAIRILKIGRVMNSLDNNILKDWLIEPKSKSINYPDSAYDLVKWIDGRKWEKIDILSEKLWEKVDLASFV